MAKPISKADPGTTRSSTPALGASDVEFIVDKRVGALAAEIARDASSGVRHVLVSGPVHVVPPDEILWAKPETWTAIATLILAVVTVGLALYTRRLARETVNVIRSDERIAQAELRAYVGIVGAEIDWSNAESITVILSMKNFGKTPAHDMRSFFCVELANSGDASAIVIPSELAPCGDISPSQAIVFRSAVVPTVPRPFVLKGLREKTLVLRGRGVVRYVDIYGAAHVTPISVSCIAHANGEFAMEPQADQGRMS